MLRPPPVPQVVKEKFTVSVSSYITPSMKKRYDILLQQKNMKWAEAIREGLKMILEGNGNLPVNLLEQISELISQRKPSKYIKEAIKTEWDTAKAGAVERELIKAGAQTPDHAKFMKEVIPDLRKKVNSKNKGLEEVPLEVLRREKPKTDQGSYYEWKMQKIKT